MTNFQSNPKQSRLSTRVRLWLFWAAVLAPAGLSGCAAYTNPTAGGIRVEQLAQELQAISREEDQVVPLSLLGQPPLRGYRVGPGDVLGIFVEGVLGDRNQPPQATATDLKDLPGNIPPGVGFPVPVQEDGTIQLPHIDPLPVLNLTLREIQNGLTNAYTVQKKIIQPGRERIIVTLLRPRQYRVVVMREDAGAAAISGGGGGGQAAFGLASRGTGHLLNLPAYENDVLHALALTGGLPGRDAYREVVIHRGQLANIAAEVPETAAGVVDPIIRIPLTTPPGCAPSIRPEDVILYSGDVLYLEARDREVFYTGGLLPAGQHVLPRNFDLDVIGAIARVGGPMINGGQAVSNLSGSIVEPGIGSPSPKLLSVVRKTPGGGQVVINVDLNRAFQNPRDRLLIKPGDVLILQETCGQALTRVLLQSINGTFGVASKNASVTGVVGSPPTPFIHP